MRKRCWRTGVLGLGCTLLLLACTSASQAQSVTPFVKLDANRLLGSWYELARLPLKREKRCLTDTVQLVAPGDKARQLTLVGSCKGKEGYTDVWYTRATQDKSGGGKFSVRTLWPLSKKYLVLAVGSDYEWALVGTANHKSLWIFSKTPTLKPEILTDVEAKAAAQGFNLTRLITVPQAAH